MHFRMSMLIFLSFIFYYSVVQYVKCLALFFIVKFHRKTFLMNYNPLYIIFAEHRFTEWRVHFAFSQRHAITMLAPSGISTSPFISASANSGSFSAVLYECALMVLMRSLTFGRRSSSWRLVIICMSFSFNSILFTIYILYLIFYI